MDYIIRERYLNKVKPFIDKPIIKVLTGMRRVGKSTLMKMIQNELLTQVASENIIHLNLDSIQMLNVRNATTLADCLMPLLQNKKGRLYLFFDEIQMVKNWEQVINGLQVDFNCDIYLTGSNSTMLSGDLATLLAGRYVNFEIYPFNFSEFSQLFGEKQISSKELFNEYLLLGGMPTLRYFDLEKFSSYQYLNDVYHTVLVKDVLEYYQIRDVDIFNRILTYAIENIGHTFSALSLQKYFRSENRKVSVDTILNYLEFCQNAFLFKKVPRYDTVGKKILKVDEKYYLTDHGFRQAKGFSNLKDIERVLENIVFVELLSRGNQVTIGKVNEFEIDFIAEKEGKVAYYQVSYLMESEATREREMSVLQRIPDNYPKYVLSLDDYDFSQAGIIHCNLIDWLLKNEG